MSTINLKNLPKKRVLVIHYGGGLGMKHDAHNVLAPAPGVLVDFLKKQRDMHDSDLAQKHFSALQTNQLVLPIVENSIVLYDIIENDPLIDSANTKPTDWNNLAADIGRHYDNYDGFVCIHGIDTMAYTASALSFMLEGLNKPVIFTGGQVSIYKTRNDSKDNLLLSLIIAGCYYVPEVCILSSSKLYRGNRTVNTSCTSLDCFTSFNYPTLADIGLAINVHRKYVRKADAIPFKVITTNTVPNIAVIKMCPTMKASLIAAVVTSSMDAIILQTYGTGTMKKNNEEFFTILKQAIDKGIIIVNITQCHHGTVSLTYDSAQLLAEIGVVNGRDMTCEAATAKLCYVLPQRHMSRKEKNELLEKNLRGEMTT